MRPLLLSFFIVLFCSSVFGQDWTFLNPNERYHFQHIDDELPLNTVFVDSTKNMGSIGIQYLNRLFLPCDTCSGDGYYLDNQPTFLQSEIHYSQISSTVQLINPKKLTLKLPNSGIGEWWFDEEQTQKAKLDTIIYEDIFETKDSIAIISINDTPEIEISKKYGLIKYFNYNLSGLENEDLGKILITVNDIYDFEVGDVLMYVYYEREHVRNDYYYKYVVAEVNGSGYELELEFIKQVDALAEGLVLLPEELQRPELEVEGLLELQNIKGSYYHSQRLSFKKPGEEVSLDRVIFSIDEIEQMKIEHKSLLKTDVENVYKENVASERVIYDMFTSGLGHTKHFYTFGVNVERNFELLGSVKNGTDTTGIIYEESDFISTNINIKENKTLTISPNPSKGDLIINLGNNEVAEVIIYSLEGKMIKSFKAESRQKHDMSNLKSGVYIISIETEGVKQQFKWIKE